ncbi:MAG TPA: ABC transporter permease, partial [bacterium]|nr:ABC transporter permease [bacterium]
RVGVRWRRIRRLRGGLAGAIVVALIVAAALLAPWLAPHNPYVGRVIDRLLPPVWMEGGDSGYLLGTDQIGRDVLSRLIYGGRVSLGIAVLAVAVAGTVGLALGLLAGFYRGWLDWTISAGVDVMLTFPFVLLALATIAVLGPSVRNVVIVLGVTGWPIYTRVVRAEVVRLRTLEFAVAARALGLTNARIVLRHIVPNLLNAVIVIASLDVARFIIVEAFLSYLGLGVQPPVPSWGGMLGDFRPFMFDRWWLPTFPGMAIFLTALAVNLVGDGLRDYLDPQSRTTP